MSMFSTQVRMDKIWQWPQKFLRRKNALGLDNMVQIMPRRLSMLTLEKEKLKNDVTSCSVKVQGFHNLASVQKSVQAVATSGYPGSDLARMNDELYPIEDSPLEILQWAMEEFDGRLAMSSSFGIQSVVLLHMATQVKPDIDVVWVDTGYLPEETYRYADLLVETLGLNLTITSNEEWTPARMEALHGKLWEHEETESHSLYGHIRKVQPLMKTLDSLPVNPLALLSGLRAAQTTARSNMKPVGIQQNRYKVLPMLKMTDDDVLEYMDKNDLPQHPLQAKGYVTVGDWHSSRPAEEGEDPRNSRFGGKFQECGLHVDNHEPASENNSEPVHALLPASLAATGIKALGLTTAHKDTDTAVIMVKKLTEDGEYCRKCKDVAEKIEQDNLTDWIGHIAVANVLDAKSEGSILAKHFEIATAPFFLVRDLETERAKGEWKIVRSYLQLRKLLEKNADRKLLLEEEGKEVLLAKDTKLKHLEQEINELSTVANQLQIELHDKLAALKNAQESADARKQELGV
uniref:Phosphoadenosine phosphosulphate reductase domain-containing protein n=1 Tax=Mucochytrium quahogii TaxID=96639 RepID=A0A7S2S0H9_9STRA|mmetsp:Transcript_7789/g.12598  ORF Transcript_7789/g.12598 Transcript_7789/m.12598 type:complete len:517 (+) Transcript_7789:95-1645(+)|eukprot:CAMPEP_0203745852 /NCGR_PEP_ID=MMETSP0098-20131031/1469_1 /ASSEMBLY_ACC=CAM_ASM_000208 /TAXON_ID=96639 /ORGANISM=" , Strain NY0313808BC1" /LENGTH=516 /DNA_ID=CAMNT_0050633759 /DNA_START=296 /DNA_END=1846 /DNA_ORIENTATION=-